MADVDEGTLFKYGVFISYSRKDIDFARKLEEALESYRPPRYLPVPQRSLRVFRDESDFTGGEYSAALDRNLRDASKLLVICSPNSHASKAVNQEIERFSAYRGTENIVPVLLAGVPNNNAKPEQEDQKAFPEALVQRLPMPLAADFRGIDGQRDKLGSGRFESAWYKTLADVYSDFHVTRDQVAGAEVRRNAQRRKVLVAGTAALLLGLSVLTGWALVERREAVRQRDEVQRREERLLEAINHVTYTFPEELRKLGPAPAILEATYRNNYTLLKELFDKDVKGPMLDLPMAVNILNLADIWAQQGKLVDAVVYLELIPERHGMLTEEEKSSPDWLERMSLAYDRIADLGQRQGDLQKAEEQHQAALRIRTEVLARNPENALRWKVLLAYSQQALCGLALERANFDGARQQCQSALDEYAKLAQTEETRADAVAGLIWSRMTLADVAEQQGKLPEVLEHLAAASMIIERDQNQNDRRLESVALHERRSKALLAMSDPAGAIVEANQALRLGQELARYADDADGRRNFAILRHDIASIYRDTGRYNDAAQQFAAACGDFESLLGISRENVELRRLLAQCLGDAGEARLLAGDPPAALKQMLRSLALQQELADGSAGQPARQLELATCHRQLGDWYAKRGAHATAIEKYRIARQILEGLATKLETYMLLQEELASIDAKIGAAHRAAKDAAASASYTAAVARYRRLSEHDPSNARWQKGLAEASDALEFLQKSGARDRASEAVKS